MFVEKAIMHETSKACVNLRASSPKLAKVERFPDSAHDSFIWNTCSLQRAFENGTNGMISSGWLVGDPSYA